MTATALPATMRAISHLAQQDDTLPRAPTPLLRTAAGAVAEVAVMVTLLAAYLPAPSPPAPPISTFATPTQTPTADRHPPFAQSAELWMSLESF